MKRSRTPASGAATGVLLATLICSEAALCCWGLAEAQAIDSLAPQVRQDRVGAIEPGKFADLGPRHAKMACELSSPGFSAI
jgi:hypothetical protein